MKRNNLLKNKKVKLNKIGESPNSLKKYRAYFSDNSHTDFGAKGYQDYTTNKDPVRKELYLSRHRSNENWNDMKSPGALSRWILWNKTSLKDSISDYKNKFNV